MMGSVSESDWQELIGELKLLRSDTSWMREEMARQATTVKDLDERVRDLEQSLARIEAKQKPAVSWPAVLAAIVSTVIATIAILDRIYN
jgi:predicted nuclease with TOPRIM domain